MAPTVANRCVIRAVRAPIREAAAAASQPACPPPITITSKEIMVLLVPERPGPNKVPRPAPDVSRETSLLKYQAAPAQGQARLWDCFAALLADAEITENDVENILHVHPTRQPPKGPRRKPQLLGNQLQRAGRSGIDGSVERGRGFPQRVALALAGDKSGFAGLEIVVGKLREGGNQAIQSGAGERRNFKELLCGPNSLRYRT